MFKEFWFPDYVGNMYHTSIRTFWAWEVAICGNYKGQYAQLQLGKMALYRNVHLDMPRYSIEIDGISKVYEEI